MPHPPRVLLVLLAVGALSCSDFSLSKPAADEEGGTDGTWGDPEWGPCGPPELSAEVSVNEACVVDVVVAPLDPEVLWSTESFSNYPESDQIVMAPVVGHLTDDDGDGTIGRGDIPDIAVITDDPTPGSSKHGMLRVLSGADGSVVTTIERPSNMDDQIFPYRYSNIALGDVDADGTAELVMVVEVITGGGGGGGGGGSGTDTSTPGGGDGGGGGDPWDTGNPISLPPPAETSDMDMNCTVGAFRVDGTAAWVSLDQRIDCAGHAPAIADLDADGKPEVVLGSLVLNGEDGSLAWSGSRDSGRYYAYAEIGLHSVVADLDGDGVQELIAGRTVYNADGSVRCEADWSVDGFNGVADLDLDGQGDFLVVGDGRVGLFDADCAEVSSWRLNGDGNGGPPTITDVDGDGTPEIGICAADYYSLYSSSGRLMWAQQVQDDSSHATGSIAFDFESDGLPEIVYADEAALYIFDGVTGEVRLTDTRHASRTLHEYPTIADIDADGSVDILVPNGGGHSDRSRLGIYALSSETRAWQAGRQVWNQHAYSVTNIDDDLGVPPVPTPNWPTHNSFRSGDPNPSNGGLWPDATSAVRVCKEECDSAMLVLDVAIANQGAGALRAGVPMVAWYEDDSGERVLLSVVWIEETTEPGTVSSIARIRVDASALAGRPIYLMADEDDRGIQYAEECDEANNTLIITDTSCLD